MLIVESLYTSTTHFNFCQLLSTVYDLICTDKTRDLDDTFREQVLTEIKEDDDVQFQWVMLSCGMGEEVCI